MPKRKTTEEFIADARKVHGDKYDYSHVVYIDARTPVEIVCNKHGAFMQTPHTHLKGSGCALCGKEAYQDRFSLGTDAFISRAKLLRSIISIHTARYVLYAPLTVSSGKNQMLTYLERGV